MNKHVKTISIDEPSTTSPAISIEKKIDTVKEEKSTSQRISFEEISRVGKAVKKRLIVTDDPYYER